MCFISRLPCWTFCVKYFLEKGPFSSASLVTSLFLFFWLPCPILSSSPLPHASSQSGGCLLASPFHRRVRKLCLVAVWTLRALRWGRPCLTSSGSWTLRIWHRRMRCQWAGMFSNWAAFVSQLTTPAWPWAALASLKLWRRSLSNVREHCASQKDKLSLCLKLAELT